MYLLNMVMFHFAMFNHQRRTAPPRHPKRCSQVLCHRSSGRPLRGGGTGATQGQGAATRRGTWNNGRNMKKWWLDMARIAPKWPLIGSNLMIDHEPSYFETIPDEEKLKVASTKGDLKDLRGDVWLWIQRHPKTMFCLVNLKLISSDLWMFTWLFCKKSGRI